MRPSTDVDTRANNETVRISCRIGAAAFRKLAQHFGKQMRVAVVARNHKGKVLLSVKDVPLEQMERLTEALLDSLGSVRWVRSPGTSSA